MALFTRYEKTFRDSFFTNSVSINRIYSGLGVGVGNAVISVDDTADLDEAAENLGAGTTKRFFRVTLPLAMPGVVAAVLIVFIPTVGDYVTPELVGGPSGRMIANWIQSLFLGQNQAPLGAATAIVAMLAVGTRFAEICTGSYGAVPPKNLVHVDINPGAIGRNHPAAVAIHADARDAVPALAEAVTAAGEPRDWKRLAGKIAADKVAQRQEWLSHDSGGRVNPARFFGALRERLADDAIVVAVAHRQFRELGSKGIRTFGKPHCVLYDVKHILPARDVDGRL